jgi:hypothetical protein
VEMADIETFVRVITEGNRTQTALYAVWCSVHVVSTVIVGCVWIDCDW